MKFIKIIKIKYLKICLAVAIASTVVVPLCIIASNGIQANSEKTINLKNYKFKNISWNDQEIRGNKTRQLCFGLLNINLTDSILKYNSDSYVLYRSNVWIIGKQLQMSSPKTDSLDSQKHFFSSVSSGSFGSSTYHFIAANLYGFICEVMFQVDYEFKSLNIIQKF